ncbi:MAG: hypothetical protein IJU04_05960 [Ruminococcus sp.]|nr:hypothetical protein [Ruminococcus sp.]
MKRILCSILALLMLVGVFASCSDSDKKSKKSDSGYEFTTFVPNPDETFKKAEINEFDGNGGNTYLVQVTNYQDGEFEQYVKKCQEAGFNNITEQTNDSKGKTFGATDKNGELAISVVLNNSIKAIIISCHTTDVDSSSTKK